MTPKQLLLFNSLSSYIEKTLGAKTLVTARDTGEMRRLNSILGEKAKFVGTYGKNKKEKLTAEAERIIELAELVDSFSPDYLVSYPSPSAVRVAFGLGIKTVIYSDTPHAFHVHALTIPLSDYFIFSSFIDKIKFERFITKGGWTRIFRYKGVEELAWVEGYTPNEEKVRKYGLEPYKYFLVRPPEIFASYYGWGTEGFKRIVKRLSENSKVALIPRYDDDALRYNDLNVEIISEPVLGLDLEYYSIATVSGGGTMSREAALLGVPSVTLFPLKIDVDAGLRSLGFPIYRATSYEEAMKIINGILTGSIKRVSESAAGKLEHPAIPLQKILEGDI